MSESASRRVERYCKMGRLLLFDKFEDIFGEPEKYGCVHAFGVDHRMSQECIIHLEDQGVSVNQK